MSSINLRNVLSRHNIDIAFEQFYNISAAGIEVLKKDDQEDNS